MPPQTKRLSLSQADKGELEVDGIVYPVKFGAALDVEDMAELLDLQLMARDLQGGQASRMADEDMPREEQIALSETLRAFLRRGKEIVMRVVREDTPDAPDLRFNPTQLANTIAFLSTGEVAGANAIDEVARGLSEEAPPGDDPDAESDPTTSQARSRQPLSPSRSSSTSSRDGGEERHGETSALPSDTSTSVQHS